MTEASSPIVIEPYDPFWIKMFEDEASLIRALIGGFITDIEHIGSTAVPGLAAKPVIDILIGVHHITDSPLFIPPLTTVGYVYKPEYEDELPERRYLHKKINGVPTHHLHIVEPGTEFFRRHLAFRDYLRSHRDSALAYAALKISLAEKFGSDRSGYTDAKSDFIKDIERKALRHPKR
jgi:GrpB-like predicted nucleotidyltransferase (UPF0157 family)